MKSKESRIIRRKLIISRVTSTISLALVMFMLGLIGYLLMNAHQVSVFLKENIGITLILKENIKETEVNSLTSKIESLPEVKSVTFISQEQAAKELEEDLGQDFISFLGYNPLSSAIEIKMNADYSHPDSVSNLAGTLLKYNGVNDVSYQKDFITSMSNNIKKLSVIFLVFSLLLASIAIFIINHSVRLTVYSKRFLLKTMQWVGASHAFIRKPFLQQSFKLGFLGSVLANLLLISAIYWGQNQIEGLISLNDFVWIGTLMVGVFVLGICLHVLFTYFSVNKYLNIKEEYLYY